MKKNEKVRVLIADDHQIIRNLLTASLAYTPAIEVVGYAKDGEEAVKLTLKLKPDIVLMDVRMPNLDGIEATRIIRLKNRRAKVIIFTGLQSKHDFQEAINAGAKGYISKDTSAEVICKAILKVYHGKEYLKFQPTHFYPTHQMSAFKQKISPDLTEQEEKVLHLMLQGCSAQDIAHLLSRNERMVRIYRQNIRKKLKVETDIQIALLAVKLGIDLSDI